MLASTTKFGLTEPSALGDDVFIHTQLRASSLEQKDSNTMNISPLREPGACPRLKSARTFPMILSLGSVLAFQLALMKLVMILKATQQGFYV